MKLIIPLLVVLVFAFVSPTAKAANECGGVLPFGASQADVFNVVSPQADGNYYSFYCMGTNEIQAACGVNNWSIRVTVQADDNDCWAGVALVSGETCEDHGLVTNGNFCDTPPPDPCAAVEDVREFYECTGATYSEAVACAEGAVDSNGCYLETTVDPYSPDCVATGTPVSEGGAGQVVTCFVDLTGTGDLAPPGNTLPSVDNDVPNNEIAGDETNTDSTDTAGCELSTTVQTTVTDNGDGTLTRCSNTVETFGTGCPDPGADIVATDCTTTYSDGSQTNTTSNTETDSGDVVTSTENTTTTTGGDNEIPKEGEDSFSAGGNCSTPPSCSGDTLQCAIIKQQFDARCDFVNSVDSFSAPTDDPTPSNTAVDVDAEVTAFLATDGWLTNRSCPTVPAISVMGQSLSWSFEGVCEAFGILSFLVLGFAGFTGIRVFMGAF